VPMRRAISERETWGITAIFGTRSLEHEGCGRLWTGLGYVPAT
jgi:hypothetical protein